jgi:hypothetical protein
LVLHELPAASVIAVVVVLPSLPVVLVMTLPSAAVMVTLLPSLLTATELRPGSVVIVLPSVFVVMVLPSLLTATDPPSAVLATVQPASSTVAAGTVFVATAVVVVVVTLPSSSPTAVVLVLPSAPVCVISWPPLLTTAVLSFGVSSSSMGGLLLGGCMICGVCTCFATLSFVLPVSGVCFSASFAAATAFDLRASSAHLDFRALASSASALTRAARLRRASSCERRTASSDGSSHATPLASHS